MIPIYPVVQPVGEDYYDLLGVSRDASRAEIRQAYRARIKETHPDVSDDESAHEHTKRLIEAKDVLTDEEERRRYDRLGHEAYVDTGGSAGEDSGGQSTERTTAAASSNRRGTDRSNANRQSAWGATATDGQRGGSAAGGRATGESRGQSSTSRKADGGQAGNSADWYDTNAQRERSAADGPHRAWDSERSYAVGHGRGLFEPAELLSSQRTVILLGTTFVIYPVLLFGALWPPFPTSVNLVVAMCIVLVIAFMQSVPRVAMLVFGTWIVLLPIGLFGVLGVSPLTLRAVFAMAAVCFPFGLSILTWIAIRPMRR